MGVSGARQRPGAWSASVGPAGRVHQGAALGASGSAAAARAAGSLCPRCCLPCCPLSRFSRLTCCVLTPAVYPDGRVCISILHAPGDDPMGYESSAERWSPVQSVEKILLSVVSMLAGKAAPGGGRGAGRADVSVLCPPPLFSVTVVSVRASSTYAVSAFSRNYSYAFMIMSLYVGQSEPHSGPWGSRSWSWCFLGHLPCG